MTSEACPYSVNCFVNEYGKKICVETKRYPDAVIIKIEGVHSGSSWVITHDEARAIKQGLDFIL